MNIVAKKFNNRTLSLKTLVPRVVCIMQLIERYCNNYTGAQKKQMVISIMSSFFVDEEATTNTVIQLMVPTLIDHVILIDKKKIKINKKFNIFSCCTN